MRYILTLTVLFAMAFITNADPPHHPHHVPNTNGPAAHQRINVDHRHFKKVGVVRNNWGYAYQGRTWHHWEYTKVWSRQYGCYCNYCPYTYTWYYWCKPDLAWYPLSHCPYNTYSWD